MLYHYDDDSGAVLVLLVLPIVATEVAEVIQTLLATYEFNYFDLHSHSWLVACSRVLHYLLLISLVVKLKRLVAANFAFSTNSDSCL